MAKQPKLKNNMTLTDNRGRSIKCRLVWVRRQAAPRKPLARVVSREDIILGFDSVTEARRVLYFTWGKVLGKPLSALKSRS